MQEKFLPFFPLNLVVYPDENLNLHVFEPRYKQLIHDCIEQNTNFGIPSFINEEVAAYGTEVKIVNVEKTYDDGKMDIKTKGVQVFKVLSFDQKTQEKLYAGGTVEVIPHEEVAPEEVSRELISNLKKLYEIIKVGAAINIQSFKVLSYQLAHKIGLSLEQQYEMLKISSEHDRQLYLLDHLKSSIPLMEEMERTKEIIRMNGHFKNLDPLDF
ncbi:LON peptidase substrate-binding domain-containing protein [Microscilla marina]|uniref:ATP-dependent Lon protease, putative n=1 Tax=Microscilla marina ATCC 23134 TaxID=313606 RepID=A1ZJ81_MICM2|nr:LON peptidase substrate-binding domain-containing protein [Microscilla marina]EAY29617.1 ATP-dependent Lon protease, putative [Microscilla marina ATCC 23134]